MTVFENKCPLNSFSFLRFMIIKINKPKINIPNVKIVYHLILQVHSIYHNVSCVATTPTSFVCCKARLATKGFSFVCLHSIQQTNIVTNNEIIVVTNRKTFEIKLSKKNLVEAWYSLEQYIGW